MAGISRDLTLVDKFSSVWDKFIHKAKKAEEAVEALAGDSVEDAVERVEEVTRRLTVSNERNIEVLKRLQRSYKMALKEFGRESEEAQYALESLEAKLQDLGMAFNKSERVMKTPLGQETIASAMPLDEILRTYDLTTLIDKKILTFKSDLREFALVWEEIPPKVEEVIPAVEEVADAVGDIVPKTQDVINATELWQSMVDQMGSIFDTPIDSVEHMLRATDQMVQKFGEASEEGKSAFLDLATNVSLNFKQLMKSAESAGSGSTGLLRKIQKLADEGKINLATKQMKQLEAAIDSAGKTGEKSHSKLGRTLTRLGVMFFGLRKIVQAVKNSMERVPDAIMKPYNDLKKLFSDDLARVTTSLFKGMQKGLERLNQVFESPAGRKFVAALQVGFEAIGAIIGAVAGIVADFMDMLFTNLEKTEINFTSVGEVIGKIVGGVYTVVYNIVATIWNLVASFAEFLGNVFTDPLGAVVRLVADVVNTIVGVVAWAARQIDKLLGTNYAAGIVSFQDNMMDWVEEKFGQKAFTLERMEYIDIAETMEKFGIAGAGYGSRIESAFKGGEALNDIKASSAETAGNTKAIKDAVTDEDLKLLIDVATQKFVSNVNLTSQTPIITINGANTGNTEADRKRLVNDLKYMLVEQLASGSTSGQYAYAGS